MKKYPPINTPHKGFAHQDECRDISWDLDHFALLMEMGTGKTKVAIDTMAGLFYTGQIGGALILAPKGVYMNWVRNEIPEHWPKDLPLNMASWHSIMNREQTARLQRAITGCEGHLDVMVMNIEALNSERAMSVAIGFLQNHDAITIIDESTCIKNPQAGRTKRALTLGKMSKYRRIMTGTPITQSPLDLFSQFQFLKPGSLGFTSFSAFRAYYAIMITMQLGTRSFPKITGYRNLESLQNSIRNISYRKLKSECLDLPDKLYQTRYVQLTPEQQKMYDTLRDEAVLQLQMGQVTTTSALTTIMRLQQIVCGHITLDDGTIQDLPHGRLDALDEIIDEIPGKIIIWCNFRRDVEALYSHLNRSPLEQTAVHFYGGSSDEDRSDALVSFKNDPNCRFFIGTPGTGGRGLTLVESAHTIYYSNGYNLEHRLQSEDRNHRIGQTRNVTIIDIVAEKTVDERIVKILKEKKNLADTILDSLPDLLQL